MSARKRSNAIHTFSRDKVEFCELDYGVNFIASHIFITQIYFMGIMCLSR